MKLFIYIGFLSFGEASQADTLIAARMIPSRAIITFEDIQIKNVPSSGVQASIEEVLGKEARVAIYAGRPIRLSDVVSPALVERNEVVSIDYTNGLLSISIEARSLGRGGAGDVLRFMNLASRTTITGTVQSDGSIIVKH